MIKESHDTYRKPIKLSERGKTVAKIGKGAVGLLTAVAAGTGLGLALRPADTECSPSGLTYTLKQGDGFWPAAQYGEDNVPGLNNKDLRDVASSISTLNSVETDETYVGMVLDIPSGICNTPPKQ